MFDRAVHDEGDLATEILTSSAALAGPGMTEPSMMKAPIGSAISAAIPEMDFDGRPAAPVTWVIVTNGCRARIFESRRGESGISLAMTSKFYGTGEETAQAVRRRTFDRAMMGGAARTLPGPMPAAGKPCRTRTFVTALSRMLETNVAAGNFSRLIIAAPPQVLGDLRGALSSTLRSALVCEVNRDLTSVGTCDLPVYLGAALKG